MVIILKRGSPAASTATHDDDSEIWTVTMQDVRRGASDPKDSQCQGLTCQEQRPNPPCACSYRGENGVARLVSTGTPSLVTTNVQNAAFGK